MILLKATWFLQLIGYGGITIWPFVLYRYESDKTDPVFLTHEGIHIAQQKEMFVIGFYLWYLAFYLVERVTSSHIIAYRNIPFEKEAYMNDHNIHYLSTRRKHAWINYL
jgi:hypothetical protein